MGFLETVLNGRPGPLTEIQQRFLQNSYKSSERLLKLIEELLTISRIQQGSLRLDKHPFSPAEAVQNVREMVQSLVAAKSIGLEVENQGLVEKSLVGDQDRLEQVIINLIGNALKFTPEGGQVGIYSGQVEGCWQFKVVDTGIGIPEAELPHLFQRFYRASNTTAAQIQGTGLGLYVCKAIIEGHGGQIGLESQLNRGTTAWFKVPLTG
jgi:signal transduction histidine kinase